jgi:hypothetical protein
MTMSMFRELIILESGDGKKPEVAKRLMMTTGGVWLVA